jgi:hypothetical protein
MSVMPQPSIQPPMRGKLQKGPNGWAVKASGPAPAAPPAAPQSAPANVSLRMDAVATEGIVAAISQLAQAAAAASQAALQAAQMVAMEIAQLRAAIGNMQPPVVNVDPTPIHVAAPNVTVASPSVSVSPQITAQAGATSVQSHVEARLPPARERSFKITFDEHGNAEGTVS